jgi:ribonuclease HI
MFNEKGRTMTLIEVASDASYVPGGHRAWAWVDERGRFDFGTGPRDSNQLELLAIMKAIYSHRDTGSDYIIYSDSRFAVRKAKSLILEGSAYTPSLGRMSFGASNKWRRSKDMLKTGQVELKWVRSHSDHMMNVAADQVATFVRRNYAANLGDENAIKSLVRPMLEQLLSRT